MTSKRLAAGGRIDRTTRLPFTWNGKTLHGHPGDTLASALLSHDVYLLGRSFKYHRPRGVMSAGVEESGALLTIGAGARRDPNVKASTLALSAGLQAASQNAWPSVHFDVGALANVFGRFLAAGFYYKTFMGPRMSWRALKLGGGTGVWMGFEKIIRRAAGLGAASREPDPEHYEHGHAFCDVLVIGGGAAGLAAAAAAARNGLDTLVVEQDVELGGDLLNRSAPASQTQLAALLADAKTAGARTMTRTTAFGLYDHGVAGLLEQVAGEINAHQPRQRFWTVRAAHTIIAAGALERGFAFGNNDRPGVMTAAAARAYLNRYAVLPGEHVVVATHNDSAYATAVELAAAGAEVLLLDARAKVHADLRELAENGGVAMRMGSTALKALGARRVSGLQVATADGAGWRRGGREPCDLVLVSGGWSPTIHINAHREKPRWHDELACFLADDSPQITLAGAAAGIWRTAQCETSGIAAAARATAAISGAKNSKKSTKPTAMPAPGGWQTRLRPLYEIRAPDIKLKSFVDPQHDVTTDDIRLAHREGYVSVEHLKRYTTLGMATDGGKVGNVIGLALMAQAAGKHIADVGATMFRPPYTPVALGALRGRHVGEHFRPLRRTPMHGWNLDHGAVMTMAGLWHRPWYFPSTSETLAAAYVREAGAVRETVGLCDVTSLGKIAIQGPDASAFLNRIYTNPFAKLPIGRARYGIMLRDDGIVMDDGTTWRLSDSDYFMTTTTAHAGKVMAWLEELLQTRWHDLRVHVTSVTDQWAGCAVAGPQSRAVLRACVAPSGGDGALPKVESSSASNLESNPASNPASSPESKSESSAVSDQMLPFMGVIETQLAGGIPGRIARISFSGEMAFEVYVPANYGAAMMDLLWAAAQPLGGCLYGLEALGALRIEKGHVTAAELDGRVTIDDAGLGKMASPNKSFIGSALRQRAELLRPGRPQLVGIWPKNRGTRFNAGAILCRAEQLSGFGEGWITAVTESPALGHWVGLGFIAGGCEAWQNHAVVAADPVRGAPVAVDIVSPHMFDPSGARMHG